MTTAQEWRARAYEIIGRTVVLEAHLDATLALVNARDVSSFSASQRVSFLS